MPLPNNPNIVNDQLAELAAEQAEVATPVPQGPQPDPDATAAVIAHLMNQQIPNPFADMPDHEPTQPAPPPVMPPLAFPPQLTEAQPFTWIQPNKLYTYEDYGMTMKTKKPKTAKPSKEKGKKMDKCMDGKMPEDPSTIISIYDNSFSESRSFDWCFYEGLGWLHTSEKYSFNDDYKECWITKRYKPVADLLNGITRNSYGDTENCYVSISAAQEKGWFKCQSTSRYCDPKFKTTVRRSPTELSEISIYAIDRVAVKCDYTKELWLQTQTLRIKDSATYKIINKFDAANSGKFGRCPSCGNWFEINKLKSHQGIMDGMAVCDSCYNKLRYKNAIGAWNFKEYPSPIYSQVYRLGHCYDEAGLVCATNEKETVSDIRLLGVEAEVELWKEGCVELGLNRFDMALRVKQVLGEDFVSCKEDGTLTMNGKYNDDSKFDPDGTKQGSKYGGFEIVTCPADIAVQRDRWARIEDAESLHNKKGTLLLRAWDTDTCGFHVHVSRESLTKLQIGRMLKFINSTKNARFIHKIAGRGSDVFCRYQDKELPDVLHPDRVVAQEEQNAYNRSRRVALNLSNDATVEFRIFKGTIHPNHILRNLCFVMAVCDYCYPASRSFADMEDYGKFIYFVTKNIKNSNYKELAAWFVKEGEVSKRKIMDGIDPKKLTINPDFVAECDTKMKPTKIAAKKPKTTLSALLENEF